MKLRNVTRFGLVALATLSLNSGFCQTPAPAETPSYSTSEVIKLFQAGTGDEVVLAYVKNSQLPFNLSANDILTLKNAGVSSPVITAMLQHDTTLKKTYLAAAAAPATPVAPQAAPAAPVPVPVAAPATAPGAVQVIPPPPPAQVEVVTVAPGPDYYWDPGYWSWSGHTYIWIGGSWGCHPHGYWGGHWGGYYGHPSAFRHGHWR